MISLFAVSRDEARRFVVCRAYYKRQVQLAKISTWWTWLIGQPGKPKEEIEQFKQLLSGPDGQTCIRHLLTYNLAQELESQLGHEIKIEYGPPK